jgi:hypothetical protein
MAYLREPTCDCAGVPPTMPTYRDTHLPTCPVAVYERGWIDGRRAYIEWVNRRALELMERSGNA